jgi:hypothetical protein
VIGIVVSGLLGLAVPYGAWLGLSKLGLLGGAKPPAAESDNGGNSTSALPESEQRPPDPKSFDEWPGIDENRFVAPPKEVPKNVQPSQPGKGKKGTIGSGQF